MKTKYLFFAASALVALASCSNEEYIGDNNGLAGAEGDGSIQFSYTMPNATRADIYGDAAATKLGGHFYVIGTKADMTLVPAIPTNSPTTQLVFDNYSVTYNANTAGTTASNTANWEYVGVVADAKHVKLSPNPQTIKYWDYSTTQYDFHAFSTGIKKAVVGASGAADEIGVTKSSYGTSLASGATAYTFDIPNAECLGNLYVTDITPVAKTSYGKDVQLKFKNLGSKIRIALYETVPGYSVQASSVKFYADATSSADPDVSGYVPPTTTGTLISTAEKGMPNKGTIKVSFPNVGTSNSSNANYNKASVDVDADESNPTYYEFTKTFGVIDQTEMVPAEAHEAAAALTADQTLTATQAEAVNSAIGSSYATDGTATITAGDATKYNVTISYYIGRSLPNASFVGDPNADFYQLTFPVDDSHPLTLRVDYTLISTDGSGETITVHGAKAVVPSTYTVWQPNYAYTYIFKISDNTNGTTDYTNEGLTAITFDAYVADFTEVSGEQKTITTVATPSITTYQQNHADYSTADEYDRSAGKNIYVQVKKADGTLANNLSETTADDTYRSILYSVAAGTTEAVVMDALEKRTNEALDGTPIVGRNGVTLTPNTEKFTNGVAKIENGVDDNPIDVAAGTTAKIDKTIAVGTYAYVYDYSDGEKNVVSQFQLIDVSSGSTVGETGKTYYSVAKTALDAITPATAKVTINDDNVYFSKTTTDGGTTYTYSFISVVGKTELPIGTVVYPKSSITTTVAGGSAKATDTFYFDKYFSNDGAYAVKVIKVI